MTNDVFFRDKLREQHALADEINIAMSTNQFSEVADEEDLDAELEGLEQEAMDERMLNTGPVPVNSQLDRLPAVGTSDCKLNLNYSPDTVPVGLVAISVSYTNSTQYPKTRQPPSKKTTKRPSWPSCAPKWPSSYLFHHLSFIAHTLVLWFAHRTVLSKHG